MLILGWRDCMTWINAIVQGLLLGGLYALLAAGLSLVFGVMRIVNLAHGVLALLKAWRALATTRCLWARGRVNPGTARDLYRRHEIHPNRKFGFE